MWRTARPTATAMLGAFSVIHSGDTELPPMSICRKGFMISTGIPNRSLSSVSRLTTRDEPPAMKSWSIFSVDVVAMKKAEMAPDSILVDEAFRYVYGDDTIDFDHLDRFDFAKMSKALIRSVNARVKGETLVDVGVQEFTYAPVGDTHRRP